MFLDKHGIRFTRGKLTLKAFGRHITTRGRTDQINERLANIKYMACEMRLDFRERRVETKRISRRIRWCILYIHIEYGRRRDGEKIYILFDICDDDN